MSLLIEELFFGRGLAHCYGCSFGDRPVMAVQLERQLKAAQKFLIGVQSLPNFLEIRRKQLTELLRCSGKVNVLSIDASGRLLEAVNEALCFSSTPAPTFTFGVEYMDFGSWTYIYTSQSTVPLGFHLLPQATC